MDTFAGRTLKSFLAIFCAITLVPGPVLGQQSPPSPPAATTSAAPAQQPATKIPNDQLDSLVAPIALYPDPLLAQTLAASTYPLEIMQLYQWLQKNKGLNEQALADAVSKQNWEPSIQAMAALPDVVKRLADDVQWTTDLGNAFLAQQGDVMEAVQRMRLKAKDSGNLKSNEQIKVETKSVESQSVIVVEQANPQVIYVPSYNPTVVYGAPVYPYPPIYYPPAGYYAAGMAISFGVGIAMGAMWGGGWGWGCGWGGGNNNIYVNRNNNFNRNYQGGNRTNIGSGNRDTWQHNPQHRGGTPYSDRGTADRFGGTARGDSLSNRQADARQQLGNQGGNLQSQRGSGAGNSSLGDRSGSRVGDNSPGGGRTGNAGAGVSDRSSGINNRSGGNVSGGGADRVGTRDMSGGSNNRSAFGSGSGGFNGSNARSNSSRGSSSMRSSGGRSGGGGGRTGGGGGRRR
jgi:hypothetical protein